MSKIVHSHNIFSKWLFTGLIIASLFALAAPNIAMADAPVKETFFICPSVSTHSPNGMWVVGTHGAYYVNIPAKGGANDGSKVYLTIPVWVPDLAQVPAGWGLYKDLPTFPNFEGTTVLLAEGTETWLGSPSGWEEGDMATVANNGDGTYTVTNLRLGSSVTIGSPIPLASAAVW